MHTQQNKTKHAHTNNIETKEVFPDSKIVFKKNTTFFSILFSFSSQQMYFVFSFYISQDLIVFFYSLRKCAIKLSQHC